MGVGVYVLLGLFPFQKLEKWQKQRIAFTFFYFSSMEGLQFGQYLVLNDCSSLLNVLLTVGGWVHLAFQPLASNLAFSAFDPKNQHKERDGEWKVIWKLCIAGGVCWCLRMFVPWALNLPDNHPWMCTHDIESICAKNTCAVSGVVHLAWNFRLVRPDYWAPNIFFHFLMMFISPVMLGMYMGPIILFLTGPGLTAYLYSNITSGTEIAAIWCFFSIGEALSTVLYQVGRLYVNKDKQIKTN